MSLHIREEWELDHTAVYQVNLKAFKQEHEASLVNALRKKYCLHSCTIIGC